MVDVLPNVFVQIEVIIQTQMIDKQTIVDHNLKFQYRDMTKLYKGH